MRKKCAGWSWTSSITKQAPKSDGRKASCSIKQASHLTKTGAQGASHGSLCAYFLLALKYKDTLPFLKKKRALRIIRMRKSPIKTLRFKLIAPYWSAYTNMPVVRTQTLTHTTRATPTQNSIYEYTERTLP